MALARGTFALQRVYAPILAGKCIGRCTVESKVTSRSATTTRSGAILPKPKTTPFGFLGVVGGVVVGLFIGAAISKNVANFLEENDLFVPSDDDDDDD